MRWLGALLVLAASPAFAESDFSGIWFGSQPYDHANVYLLTIRPDGTFQTQHRRCLKGEDVDYLVTGSWMRDGEMITYHVATVAGQNRPRVDPFRLVSLDDKQQITIFLPRNLTYTAQRVGSDFVLPSCRLVS